MSKKLQGFTIAELLISLLIISLVLSAAIPTVTRKTAGNESIWQWSETPNSAFFGVSEQQAAIIGNTYKPDGGVLENPDTQTNDIIDKFVNSGDKLVLVKKAEGLSSSHISFYNVLGDTTTSISYAGRLVMDPDNIGLGRGALAKTENNFCSGGACTGAGNTAIGPLSLIANETGIFNTAVGIKTLSKNVGSNNTALGSYSSFGTNGADAQGNTGVGAFTLTDNKTGSYNTATGFYSLGLDPASAGDDTDMGSRNTAAGAFSCYAISGDNNICLGYAAGTGISGTSVATRYGISSTSNNVLYIGYNGVPLILGRLESLSSDNTPNTKRMLAVNTQDFDINAPMADYNIFRINTSPDNASLNFIPYQTAAGVSRQIRITADNDNGVYINSNKYTATNTESEKHGTLSLNGARILISEDDNGTTSVSAGNGTDKTLGDYKINLTKGNISLFGSSNKKLIFMVKQDPETASLKNFDISSDALIDFSSKTRVSGEFIVKNNNTYLNSKNVEYNGNGTGSKFKFNAQTEFNKEATFNSKLTTTVTPEFTTDAEIPGIASAGASSFTPPAYPKQIGSHIIAIWGAVNKLHMDILGYHSDARLKNVSGDSTAGLKEINALEVKNYTYKNDKEKKPHVGVIAQQLQKVFPNSVFKDEDGYLRVNNDEMFFAMINSIKELFAKIQDLTAKITGLDSRLKKLEQENAQLKKQNAEFEKRLKKLEAARS